MLVSLVRGTCNQPFCKLALSRLRKTTRAGSGGGFADHKREGGQVTGAERVEIATVLDAIEGLLDIADRATPEVARAILALVKPVQRQIGRRFGPSPGVDGVSTSPLAPVPVLRAGAQPPSLAVAA